NARDRPRAARQPPDVARPRPVGARQTVATRGAQAAWSTSLDGHSFAHEVEKLRELVRTGDLFQANLATRFEGPCTTSPVELLAALRTANPSPYMAILDDGVAAIVSGSPENLFTLRAGIVSSRPIAGTRKRGATAAQDGGMEAELRSDAKEQ